MSGWGGNCSKVRKNGRAERLKGGKVHFSSDWKRIRGLADARVRSCILLYILSRMRHVFERACVRVCVGAATHTRILRCLVACLLTCMRACVLACLRAFCGHTNKRAF